jgi:DNA-binding LacI/PurR family transcriptional regulator
MPTNRTRRQPTLTEVAERAGVSRAVASRAINDVPNVSRAKRDAVRRAVLELGYTPNRAAQALATRRTGAVVLAISGDDPEVFADPFFARVVVGISATLEETPLHLVLCLAATVHGQRRLKNLIDTRGVDGMMVMAMRGEDPVARIASSTDLPVVFGGRPLHFEPEWYVDADNVGGARLATEHLIHIGRTRVVAIAGTPDTHVAEARCRGYQEAMTMAGLEPYPVDPADFTEAGGYAAMGRLLRSHPDLDAVFAANDNMAVGALRALREVGRLVPEQVAVVGFDDLAIASQATPQLTTVQQPVRALGEEMARMLVALIGGRRPTPLILPTRLVVRAST